MPSRHPLRATLLLLLCTFIVAGACAGAYQMSRRMGLADLQTTGRHRLDLYAASLEREIGKYAFFPATLELETEVLGLLESATDTPRANAVNTYLERLSERAGTLSIYVLDATGIVRAASNWRRNDSFIGENLTFRRYVQDALNTGSGRFFGIGTTRGEPGLYLSSALAAGGRTLGVAVVKVSLEQLEKSWSTVEAPVLVADENGVVILSSVADWKFTTLRPLDDATRAAFDRSQQYNRRALQPLPVTDIEALDHGARLVRVARENPELVSIFPIAGRFLAQTQPLAGTPWMLTVYSHTEQVEDLAVTRAGLAGAAAVLLCIVAAMLEQRRRHTRDRLAAREALQRAHDELERKVVERTADLTASNARLQDEIAERIRAERTLRAAQDELIQAGKLAVIGQMSTGIAHELNQPLAGLRTLSANAVRFLARGDAATAQTNLERIAQLVDRMGLITGELRSFAHKSSGRLARVDARAVIDQSVALLEQRIYRAHAEVAVEFAQGEIFLLCDANRLQQVIVNLLGNALDAMAGQTHPRVEISAQPAGERVRLVLRDHGPGLAPEALARLFEPFFTTKEAGVGLGLGLTISAGILKDFGGCLTGANHPAGGAQFMLEIPCATEEARP